ncbi:MAG: diguanylate cyclase [Chloroflexi bacterium]|nr:diguanylate cyclase [Chloroflexota bacterium]
MTERSAFSSALADAASVLARGGDLDSRLAALVSQVHDATGAQATVLYLVDGATADLLAVAADGVPADDLGRLSETSPTGVASRAVASRRTEVAEAAGTDESLGHVGGPAGLRHVMAVPLVTADTSGGEEVEGALVVGFASERTSGSDPLLDAFADLLAVAVRQARLERALIERSDWFDRLAHTDGLTGLANRRTFDRLLELELARALRQGSALSLALFRVDGIARHGGDAGSADELLRRIASTVADSVRIVDTAARFGPAEFAVVAPGSAGWNVAQRVVAAVGALEGSDGSATPISAGVAQFPEQGNTAEALLAAAVEALESAPGGSVGTGIPTPRSA